MRFVVLLFVCLGVGCASTPHVPEHVRRVDDRVALEGCKRLERFTVTASMRYVGSTPLARATPAAKIRAAEHPDADTVYFVGRDARDSLGRSIFTVQSYHCGYHARAVRSPIVRGYAQGR